MAHVPRLYVPGRLGAGPLLLDGAQARRLSAVMRLREGDEFRVFAGDGREWRAVVVQVSKRGVQAEVRDVTRHEPQSRRVIELWCSMVRPNRFDWALEKCVEAGADIIRPLLTNHAVRGETSSASRQERWQRIACEAMEQCGRLYPASVENPARFEDLLARPRWPLVVADSSGKRWGEIERLLPEDGGLVVAIGPEGGFSDHELGRARAAGALIASLGPNTLRTETAAVIATGLLRAH